MSKVLAGINDTFEKRHLGPWQARRVEVHVSESLAMLSEALTP